MRRSAGRPRAVRLRLWLLLHVHLVHGRRVAVQARLLAVQHARVPVAGDVERVAEGAGARGQGRTARRRRELGGAGHACRRFGGAGLPLAGQVVGPVNLLRVGKVEPAEGGRARNEPLAAARHQVHRQGARTQRFCAADGQLVVVQHRPAQPHQGTPASRPHHGRGRRRQHCSGPGRAQARLAGHDAGRDRAAAHGHAVGRAGADQRAGGLEAGPRGLPERTDLHDTAMNAANCVGWCLLYRTV
mmetsp:Transcript_14003/g.40586  ORF Transcript_14003/g.40586 Transcript_14003/m.40586 type:complete len:244 (+) Transcript_14003:2771-3502(+)